MAKRPAGLGGVDPLAATPRIAPVIPTAPVHEDDADDTTSTADTATAAARTPNTARSASAGADRQPEGTGGRRRGSASRPTSRGGAPAPERPEGSVARLGPMSMEAGAPKKSYSFYVDPNLLEEARDTVVFLSSDPDGPRNLSALIEEGLRREIVRLQDDLHDGAPFPHRRVALRRGGNTRDM